MKPALLLVDLQWDYFAAQGLQPNADLLISRAASLLDECRRQGIPIIHIWTTVRRGDDSRLPHWKESKRWQCVEGSPGHQPPANLQPVGGECVIHKNGYNAFSTPHLDGILDKLKCDTVVIAGVHLHACVRSAAMECLERGLRVFVAEDATGSDDPIHAAATRRWLAERCVRFESTRNILDVLHGECRSELIHSSPRKISQILFEVPIAGVKEIAAATAFAKTEWAKARRTEVAARCRILERVALALEGAAPDLAGQMAIEIGKPLSHGMEEVLRAAANIRDVVRRATAFEFQTRSAAGIVRHDPLGVIALVSPWNNPVAIPIGKIAPALVYGNVVVWKPAPAATRISSAILTLLRRAGVSRSAVEIVTGDHTVAQRLAADTNVDAVTITSSAPAGYAMAEICARRCVPLQAELSGNNAAIVWDAQGISRSATEIAHGAFGFAGQRCTANRRAIINTKQFDKFMGELRAAGEKLVWGDPLDKTTDIGPVISAGKRDEHAASVVAVTRSSKVRQVETLFSQRQTEAWIEEGSYAQSVIVCCDELEHSIVQEETMSPMLVVQRAENFEHALALCNGVRHGLVAALFSKSRKLQKKFLQEAQAGMLKINSSTAGADVTLPFCGWKASAIGPPEHGEGDRLFYTRMRTVYGGD